MKASSSAPPPQTRAAASAHLRWVRVISACWLACAGISTARGACESCADFEAGTSWGTVVVDSLTEASGIAASARNVGVLWTHNDGSRKKVFAIGTNGVLLATFNLGTAVEDVEDIAVGPGPVAGVSYLYVGDIGGNVGSATNRSEVRILRVPEPAVQWGWAEDPKSADFESVETFTVLYPDGSYDAEGLMVDPVSGNVLIVTKETTGARLYSANLNTAANDAVHTAEFVGTVRFGLVSAADISADGKQIALRREDLAWLWARCDDESIPAALSRAGQRIPVIGPPTEPNGEGLAFLRDGTGYVTISEGDQPPVYFFQSLCPLPPRFTLALSNQSAFVGGSVLLAATAVGYPAPTYSWRFNGSLLAGATASSLSLSNLAADQSGEYELIASNLNGTASTTAALSVRLKPDLRVTEVQSSTAPSPSIPAADWWELTSFESQAVDLSGWAFNDASGDRTDAFVFSGGPVIAPGESVVFVEDLSPAEFRSWWGTNHVPDQVQIVTYTGSGLSLAASGDAVRLWSNLAAEPIATAEFGAAVNGVTFNYDPVSGQFGSLSQLGSNGVFRAARSADIGSPGRILAPVSAPTLRATTAGDQVILTFEGAVGRRYGLEMRSDWNDSTWIPTGDVVVATNNAPFSITKPLTAVHSFFRLTIE